MYDSVEEMQRITLPNESAYTIVQCVTDEKYRHQLQTICELVSLEQSYQRCIDGIRENSIYGFGGERD